MAAWPRSDARDAPGPSRLTKFHKIRKVREGKNPVMSKNDGIHKSDKA